MGILKITEEWKCANCGVYTKLETKKKADKDDIPTLSNLDLWIFEIMNYRTNPKTDWLRLICSQGHEWHICPHCQKSNGNKQTGRCPECGKLPKVLKVKHRLPINKARSSVL